MSADTDRQNALLDLAYQSKLFGLAGIGNYRRGVNVFADGFTTTAGVDAVQSANLIFDNILGVVAPAAGIGANVSASATAIAGVHAPIYGSAAQTSDGITSGLNGWCSSETSGAIAGVCYIGQYFTTPRQIRQMVIFQGYNGDPDQYMPSVLVQYSDNGSTWTTIATLSLPHQIAPATLQIPAAGAHLGWRLLANAAPGISNRWGVSELQMSEIIGGANMTLVTVAQPVDPPVGYGRVLIEFDTAAALALNTDITAEITCDGATWTPATLAPVSVYNGKTVIETNDQPCTAGSSFAARIKTLTNKNAPIYALAISVH